MDQILKNESILERILQYCNAPNRLIVSCKATHKMIYNPDWKSAWLQNHPKELEVWARNWTGVFIVPNTKIEYMLAVDVANTVICHMVIEKMLSSRVVFRTLFSRILNSSGSGQATENIKFGLWTHACTHSIHLQNIYTYIIDNRTEKLPIEWVKPALYALIQYQESSETTAIKVLADIIPDIVSVLPDLLVFAIRMGRVEIASLLVTEYSYKLTHSIISLLNHAYHNEYEDMIDFLLEYDNLSEEISEAVESWKTILSFSGIAMTKRKVAIDDMMDMLKSRMSGSTDVELKMYKLIWTDLVEIACAKGNLAIVTRFIEDFLQLEAFKRFELQITPKMISVAAESEFADVVNFVINAIPANIDDVKRTNVLFVKLPSSCDVRREELLYRYCAITDLRLFSLVHPNRHPTELKGNPKEIMKVDHIDTVSSIIRCGYEYSQDGNFSIRDSCIWAAFEAGNMEIAQVLQQLGANIEWMESSDAHAALKKDKTGTSMPEVVAQPELMNSRESDASKSDEMKGGMALLAGYGGNYTVSRSSTTKSANVIGSRPKELGYSAPLSNSSSIRRSVDKLGSFLNTSRDGINAGQHSAPGSGILTPGGSGNMSRKILIKKTGPSILGISKKESMVDNDWDAILKDDHLKIAQITSSVSWMEPRSSTTDAASHDGSFGNILNISSEASALFAALGGESY